MKLIKLLHRLINIISTALFLIMALITFMQVVSRYIFGVSFFWAEELSRFSMVWIAFLGASTAVSLNAHTRIDFFINLLPEKFKKLIEIFNDMVCLSFVAIISYNSIDIIIITMKNISTGLKLPMGIVYGALPVSGLLMMLNFIIRIYFRIKNVDIEGGLD